MPYFIAVVILVAVDQIVKALVRTYIPLGESVPFIPHILELTYVQNTGAAFSSMQGQTILLGIFSAAVSAVLIVVLARHIVKHPVGRWIITVVLAGALGNMIDRLFMGYVTDMFQTVFIEFAVFNVADTYVVLGIIALVIYVLFFWDRLEGGKGKTRKEEKQDAPENTEEEP